MTGLAALLSAAVALVLGDLLPLWLVLEGSLESADVLMGLAVQALILAGFTRRSAHGQQMTRADRLGLALPPVFLGVVVASQVSWDLVSTGGVAVTAASTLGALWVASRETGYELPELTGGTTSLSTAGVAPPVPARAA